MKCLRVTSHRAFVILSENLVGGIGVRGPVAEVS